MLRSDRVRLAIAALAASGLGLVACRRAPRCEEVMLEEARGSLDPDWAKRGFALDAGARHCQSTSRTLHVLEASEASPAARALRLRDDLAQEGWVVDGGAGYEAEGDFVVRMRRGGELLVFNVHRAEPLDAIFPVAPTLAIHASVGAPKP